MADTPLQRLSEFGQSVWIDYLSRKLIHGGELRRMMDEDAVVGVTSNPTIFQKAITSGDDYDEQLRSGLDQTDDDKEAVLPLAPRDVSDACALLRPVWDSGVGRDGYVSIEVDPNLASDAQSTIDEAQRLHEWIDEPNLFVKIPATEPGLQAIEEMIARGRSINVTLIFALERHAQVAEAYIRGLERLVESGGDPSTVHSVASFFVSRVDTEVDKRLDDIGGGDELLGKAGLANARAAYQRFKAIFYGERFAALLAAGAPVQRPLWASTGVKNPSYPDTMYVDGLLARETVNTMPMATLLAAGERAEVSGATADQNPSADLEALAEAGIDMTDVTDKLLRDGVDAFVTPMEKLLEGIDAKRKAIAGRRSRGASRR